MTGLCFIGFLRRTRYSHLGIFLHKAGFTLSELFAANSPWVKRFRENHDSEGFCAAKIGKTYVDTCRKLRTATSREKSQETCIFAHLTYIQ